MVCPNDCGFVIFTMILNAITRGTCGISHAFPCFYCSYNGDYWKDVVSHMQIINGNRKDALESRRQTVMKRTLENRIWWLGIS